jgi:SAM-dependent methyltransferase
MLRRFFDVNRRASVWVESRLPQARVDLFPLYETIVAKYMNARPGQLVADVGGGRSCPFAKDRLPELRTRIVAVDVSEEEIKHNHDVDETRVANIMERLPFAPGEVDMIVSRSVLEHLTDLESFVANSHTALKSGGYFIHLIPARYAPFAVINRALPAWFSKKVLYFFHPKVKGICGFPAFYDRCSHSAFTRVLDAQGFEVEDSIVSYYQSRYYDFFFPAYLLSALYEMVAKASGQKDLAAYLLIVARKR